MNGKVFMFTFFLGLASALPTKNFKALRTRRNSATNSGLGIYDGTATTITNHNYLVALWSENYFFCAGAILSDAYVITLADCVSELPASEAHIVAGSNNGNTGTIHFVKKIITHPRYNAHTGSYDFALVKIKGTFKWGEDIGNVTLPSANPQSGSSLVAAGWGDTTALGSFGEGTLMEGTMNYIPKVHCKHYYYYYPDVIFDASMSCAYNKSKTTMCDNDFGDPFIQNGILYGLMNSGDSTNFCTSSAIPVILSDVYAVVDWINEYI